MFGQKETMTLHLVFKRKRDVMKFGRKFARFVFCLSTVFQTSRHRDLAVTGYIFEFHVDRFYENSISSTIGQTS